MSGEMPRNPVWTTCLVLLALIAGAVILIYTRSIMVPFILSVFIAFVATPVVKLLQVKAKFPQWLAILVTGAGVVMAVFLASLLITLSVKSALGNFEAYRSSVIEVFNKVTAMMDRFGFSTNEFGRDELIEAIRNLPMFSYVQTAAGKMLGAVSDTALVILFVMFLLTGNSLDLPNKGVVGEIQASVRAYLVTKVVASAGTGILTGLILVILGLDMAVMFGFLAFLLNFIPTVGSLVAMLLPLPIAILQFGVGLQSILVLVLPGFCQFVIGNVVEPKMMGDSLDLHPVTILLTLMFWGLIWGVPGMILATPLVVVLKIILSKSPRGVFFSELLSGRVKI